jgi:hypothetical protein
MITLITSLLVSFSTDELNKILQSDFINQMANANMSMSQSQIVVSNRQVESDEDSDDDFDRDDEEDDMYGAVIVNGNNAKKHSHKVHK